VTYVKKNFLGSLCCSFIEEKEEKKMWDEFYSLKTRTGLMFICGTSYKTNLGSNSRFYE
jgi:hypothetical protein